MGARTVLSLEEFLRLPADGTRHELDEGELVVMPPPRFRHTQITKRIYDSIFTYLAGRATLGEVFTEAAYILKRTDAGGTVRQPDISYVNDDRPRRTNPNAYMEGAPALAVEVVSPAEAAEELARKVSQYFEAGSDIVWVVYPASREVHVFYSRNQGRGAQEAKILSHEGVLTAPQLFPGWDGIPLRKLFEE
jgi:Uma2 family endonuclease